LALLLVAVWCRPNHKMQPLKHAELERVRRLSEALYREDTFPFE
jgi:hypothetical protein